MFPNDRKEHLSDIINDYMMDENVTAEDLYQDIISEVKSWIDYHESNAKKYNSLYLKFQGLNREKSVYDDLTF